MAENNGKKKKNGKGRYIQWHKSTVAVVIIISLAFGAVVGFYAGCEYTCRVSDGQ